MENFKNQLAIFVPLTASCIIKLENKLDSIDNEIKICERRIENMKSKLENDKVKDFLDSNLNEYHQLSSTLSSTINSIDEINSEFKKLEFEIFDYKKSCFSEIEHKIDDYVEWNDLNTLCLNPLLEKTRNIFSKFNRTKEQNLIKKNDLDLNIPLIENELKQEKENYSKLDEQCSHLIDLSKHKQKLLDVAEFESSGKQQIFDEHYQKNEQLKRKMHNQKCKIVEVKSQVRKLIFDYLNKIKRLDALTEEKNVKIEEFKNLIQKYNRENIAKLNEKKAILENKIIEYDQKESDHDSKDKIKDISQSQNDPTKLIKQVKMKKMKDKLNSMNNLYDELICMYENELKIRTKSTNSEQSTCDSQTMIRPNLRRNRRKLIENDN